MSGTNPQITKAEKVTIAAVQGDRVTGERWCSSTSMVRAQRSLSAVMASTALSSVSPLKPLAAKICRISSRSPSGSAAMCRRSMASTRAASSFSALVPE